MTHFPSAFNTFNRWLITAGLIAFGALLAAQQGLITLLISSDESHISVVILSLFFVATIHAGYQARQLGRENLAALLLSECAREQETLITLTDNGKIKIADLHCSSSFAHEHLAFLAEKNRAQNAITGQDLLLDRLDNNIRRSHELGWFFADLMIKLGLLGTVLGFIYMLSSITNVTNIDLHTVQQLLTNMSGGMRVALYTTLSGLSAGILLSFQYQLLERGADQLLADIIELTEVHAIRHLQQFNSHGKES